MIENGYIKVYRKMVLNPVFSRALYFKVWMYCLFRANIQDKVLIIDGESYRVPKGSFVSSYRNIASECNESGKPISLSTLKYILNYLKVERMIEHLARRDFSHITIVNYDLYQGGLNAKLHTERTPREHRENENKNIKKDKNIYTREITKQDYQDLSEKFYITPEQVKDIHERILDWEAARKGGPHYRDMKAALRNWIKKQVDEGKIRQGEVMRPWK
jgi:hypothetical protein